MTIAENITSITAAIAKACRDCNRDPATLRLVAVSKTQSPEALAEALACGQRVFGENRVQEGREHWRALKKGYPDLRLHLIGPLQTNKVRDALELFDVIETIDRDSLARELAKELAKEPRATEFYIQVNTGEEEQKSGVSPKDLPALLALCRDLGLNVTGLMCIPPQKDPPALHFALLKKLGDRHGLENLSMGMSGDFGKAIAAGATSVRIGTALFGARA